MNDATACAQCGRSFISDIPLFMLSPSLLSGTDTQVTLAEQTSFRTWGPVFLVLTGEVGAEVSVPRID
jgi:hypothetical protein